jgi:hypothetical protein
MVKTLEKANLVNEFPLIMIESVIIHKSLSLAHPLTFAIKSIHSDALVSKSTKQMTLIEPKVPVIMNKY